MTSTFEVVNAYRQQYLKDFLAFLKSRAEEMISGGRMVLTLVGRKSRDPTSEEDAFPWEFIAQTLARMVSEVSLLNLFLQIKLVPGNSEASTWININFYFRLCYLFFIIYII